MPNKKKTKPKKENYGLLLLKSPDTLDKTPYYELFLSGILFRIGCSNTDNDTIHDITTIQQLSSYEGITHLLKRAISLRGRDMWVLLDPTFVIDYLMQQCFTGAFLSVLPDLVGGLEGHVCMKGFLEQLFECVSVAVVNCAFDFVEGFNVGMSGFMGTVDVVKKYIELLEGHWSMIQVMPDLLLVRIWGDVFAGIVMYHFTVKKTKILSQIAELCLRHLPIQNTHDNYGKLLSLAPKIECLKVLNLIAGQDISLIPLQNEDCFNLMSTTTNPVTQNHIYVCQVVSLIKKVILNEIGLNPQILYSWLVHNMRDFFLLPFKLDICKLILDSRGCEEFKPMCTEFFFVQSKEVSTFWISNPNFTHFTKPPRQHTPPHTLLVDEIDLLSNQPTQTHSYSQ